jgi:hypothetical protein
MRRLRGTLAMWLYRLGDRVAGGNITTLWIDEDVYFRAEGNWSEEDDDVRG